jgi:hypothetical protein
MRFPISITHNFVLEPIMHTFGAKPEVCYAEIEQGALHVRFGAWFDQTIPLGQIASLAPSEWPWWGGLGVKLHDHGVGVVGSTDGVVHVKLKAPVQVEVVFKVECSQLWISFEDPNGFLKALSEATGVPISEHAKF